jgi:predicted Zn finger-like uncharacterized protein
MDVRCPQCATTFEFDERQLRAQLVTLKCSVCQHLFRLELNLPTIQESQHRWMVRQEASGDILYFGGFDILHQWIMQQRIVAQDTISRTGNRWTPLSEVAELAPVFQVVESISALSRGRVESAPQPVPSPDRDRVSTMQQFIAASPPRPSQPSPPQAPQPQRAPALTDPQRSLPPRPQQPAAPQARADVSPPHASQAAPTPAVAPPVVQTGPQRAVVDEQWTIGDLGASADDDVLPPLLATPRGRALPIMLLVLLLAGAAGGVWAWRLGYLGATAPAVVAPQPEPPAAAPRQLPTSPAAAAPTAPPADEPVAAGDVAPSPEAAAALSAASAKLSEITQQAAAKAKREAKRTDPKLLAKEAKKALSREQFAKARELFHESIQQGEATPENVTGLGWALLGMGNSEAAVAQFNKALFINDGFEDAYIGLGKAERQRGRLREARKVYERHLSRFPDSRKASISRYQIEQLRAQLGE